VVVLTAAPAGGSTFAGWSGSGCSGTGTCILTMHASKSVTASFTVTVPTFTLTVTIQNLVNIFGIGSGSVTSSPAGIDCGSGTCSADFTSGTSVTLTPQPGLGSTFVGWTGACSGTGTCTVPMNSNKAVTAQFKLLGLL
jgi:List-Bact-rpt repeat protein